MSQAVLFRHEQRENLRSAKVVFSGVTSHSCQRRCRADGAEQNRNMLWLSTERTVCRLHLVIEPSAAATDRTALTSTLPPPRPRSQAAAALSSLVETSEADTRRDSDNNSAGEATTGRTFCSRRGANAPCCMSFLATNDDKHSSSPVSQAIERSAPFPDWSAIANTCPRNTGADGSLCKARRREFSASGLARAGETESPSEARAERRINAHWDLETQCRMKVVRCEHDAAKELRPAFVGSEVECL